MLVPLLRMAIIVVVLDLFASVIIGLAVVRATAWVAGISKDRLQAIDGTRLFLASATIAFSIFAVSVTFLSWDLVRFQGDIDRELQPIKQEFRLAAETRQWEFQLKGQERLLDFGGELDRVIQKRNQILRDRQVIVWGEWVTRQGNGGSRNSVEFSAIYIPRESVLGRVFGLFVPQPRNTNKPRLGGAVSFLNTISGDFLLRQSVRGS